MKHAKPLPGYLQDRYADWIARGLPARAENLRRLADDGQQPPAMVISCCDSRVHATQILGADHGDIFGHRVIASLVPPFDPDAGESATPAAVQYAVTVLKVQHLIVMGHSQCGGVQGCADMCAGRAPALEDKGSFVGRWISILRPAYESVAHLEGRAQSLALEKAAVVLSLENLMTYPFVREGVEAGTLSLHGLWTDIGEGSLQVLHPENGDFQPA